MTWQTHAACYGMDPDLFFPTKGEGAREARLTCAACPVRQPCLQFALDNNEKYGIWGGLATKERRRLRRQQDTGTITVDAPPVNIRPPRGPGRITPDCGTYAGYKRHIRHHETACDPCLAANAQHRRIWLAEQRNKETA